MSMKARIMLAAALAVLAGPAAAQKKPAAAAGKPAATKPAAAKPAAKPGGAGGACVTCHAKVNPNIVKDWELSRHSQVEVDCTACHGAAHKSKDDFAKATMPTPDTCAQCHDAQVAQFKKGKHAFAWAAVKAMPTFHYQPVAIREGLKGCGGCHKIGLKTAEEQAELRKGRGAVRERLLRRLPHAPPLLEGGGPPPRGLPDLSHGGSITRSGRCTAAPSTASGTHSSRRARSRSTRPPRPARRATCRRATTRSAPPGASSPSACRSPRTTRSGRRIASRSCRGSACSTVGQPHRPARGGEGRRRRAPDGGGVATERTKMLKTATSATPRVREGPAPAVGRPNPRRGPPHGGGIRTIAALYQEGILPKPKDYAPVPDLLTFHDAPTPIEQKLFVMFLEHRMRAFQGAFHANPDYANWYGWSEMPRDLVEIGRRRRRSGASTARRRRRRRRRAAAPSRRGFKREAPVGGACLAFFTGGKGADLDRRPRPARGSTGSPRAVDESRSP